MYKNMNRPKQDYALPKLVSLLIYRADVDYAQHGFPVAAVRIVVAFA